MQNNDLELSIIGFRKTPKAVIQETPDWVQTLYDYLNGEKI